MKTIQSKVSYPIISFLLVIVLTVLNGEAFAVCTTVNGPYSINTSSNSCYQWNSGNLTIGAGVTVTPSNGSGAGVVNTSGTVGTLANSGSLIENTTDGQEVIRVLNNVTAITNDGTIQNSSSAFSIFVLNGTVSTLTNSGTIQNTLTSIGNGQAIGVAFGSGSITNLNNLSSGSILGSGNEPIVVYGGTAQIGNISNAGTIANIGSVSTVNGDNWGINDTASVIYNGRQINSITNTGSIYTNISGGYGIYNNLPNINNSDTGTITTLNNLQGAGNAHGPLTFTGTLPTNYNIIINGTSNYGQLAVTSATGNMAFGIYTGSTVSNNTTYADILQGFTTLSNVTGTTGTYGGFSYRLVADTAHSGYWNLVFGPSTSNILTGATNLLSTVGSTLNPVLDGGTLKVDTAGSNSTAYTITSNNGKIDQNGTASTFAGAITNSGAGVNGKLIIANTGTAGSGYVKLSGTNTYSGGTEVQAGANLSIGSASNIGTGTLALVGSSTVPAVLTTTADMTISNPITVAGDPTFNVSSGTTTTVSSPITDGSSSGDVVVTGGGTLALTAVNTYTGSTTVDSGSTLALSGNGSIATSSSVSNNGTFNITGKSGNVSVLSYTQGSSGTLVMNYAPGSTQQLSVNGAASLAGALSLSAGSGSYKSGKYTLLTAGSGISGSFSSLSSNLSSYTSLNYGLSYDSNDVYLTFAPSTADTQQSLVNTAQSLQGTYTLQNSVLANSFSYDCNVFGANDICVSAGGRNTTVQAANGLNNNSALLIAAYRAMPNVRIGAYADQNLSVSNPGGTVNLGNNTPLLGLFGAWNERLDGLGAEVKVSAAYGQKNTTVTRSVVGTSEPGTGSSQLNSQGAQVTAKYGFAVTDKTIVSPYVGVRYTQNNMGGYTEGTSATVTAPLTYNALNTNATTALAGVGASYKVTPVVTTFASAGVETDTNTANGSYYGSNSSIPGLTPVNFNPNPVKTRPTATLGAYYEIEKNQRLGVTGIYRQEPFQAVSTTTVMATYIVGM